MQKKKNCVIKRILFFLSNANFFIAFTWTRIIHYINNNCKNWKYMNEWVLIEAKCNFFFYRIHWLVQRK